MRGLQMRKLIFVMLIFAMSSFAINPFTYKWTISLTADTATLAKWRANNDSVLSFATRACDTINALTATAVTYYVDTGHTSTGQITKALPAGYTATNTMILSFCIFVDDTSVYYSGYVFPPTAGTNLTPFYISTGTNKLVITANANPEFQNRKYKVVLMKITK